MPQMTALQEAAFRSANTGQTLDAADTQFVVIGITAALLLTWWAWVALQAYQSLSDPSTKVSDAAAKCARAGFLVIVVIAVMTF